MTAVSASLDALAAFAERIGVDWWIGPTPPGDALARARAIAGQLGYPNACTAGSATFLANGHWSDCGTNEWIPLSAATFDAGVIGWDATPAFILWVEEED